MELIKHEHQGGGTYSIEDTLKMYSKDLTDFDIQAFVWYNRTLGIPMTGWENWFIGHSEKMTSIALEDVDCLNQVYEKIGRFQKGDEVGKVTKFENVYGSITYVAVRKFDNSLVLVDKSLIQTESKYDYPTEKLIELVKHKSLCFLNGNFLPLHVYTNTDYDTLRKQLDIDKEYIISAFGEDVYEYHNSILSGFVKLRVNHPVKEMRFTLNPYGDIARDTTVVMPDTETETSITSAFENHIRGLKNSSFILVSKNVFIDRIIRNNSRTNSSSKDNSDDENRENKTKGEKEIADAQDECQRLFSEFLTDYVPTDVANVINIKVNELYNRSLLINTSKVPIGFKCNKYLKNMPFELKPVQQEAFKFAISRNSFCAALTVGFGKTSLMICVLSYLLGTKTIRKPLIIVPKPVINNWIKELFGFWSDGKMESFVPVSGWTRNYGILSDCGFDYLNIKNLNNSIINKYSKQIATLQNGFLIGSYEALQKMYIQDPEIRDFVLERWFEILKSDDGENIESAKESASKISQLIRKLREVNKDASVDIVSMGFDSIYFDEAHRLKNVFSGVSADKTNRVSSGFKGSPSDRALRAFFISQYFTKIKGRIGFLTATPFSNSPLEVFTMLCFLNYSELVKNGAHKISSFVELFFNETVEFGVSKDSKIISIPVMKRYKNKQILYKILSNTFIYKDDPKEANIQRPCKINYPNKKIKLVLKQSNLQMVQRKALLEGGNIDFKEYARVYPEIEPYLEPLKEAFGSLGNTKSKLGLAGKILSSSKSSAISPFCNSPVKLPFVTDEPWKELYEFSPKIKFTIDAIKEMMDYRLNNGKDTTSFLIYMGLGVNILPAFKRALEVLCDLKSNIPIMDEESDEEDNGKKSKLTYDEVEIIEGSADTDKEADRRERVSSYFNKGKVKVILGTDTIREGLNLQVNSCTLFILSPTWNSTDIKQVEGRIHRQGSKFAFARIITPLVTRTLDSFIYQKYDEKEARLGDIWSNDGLAVSSDLNKEIPPEKQKELLLDDADEIAKIRVDLLAKQERNQYEKIQDEFNALLEGVSKADKYKYYVGYYRSRMPQIRQILENNHLALTSILKNITPETVYNIKNRKDRISTLIPYYEDLLAKVSKAEESGLVVDMVNIFNGEFKRRKYHIDVDYYEKQVWKEFCDKLGISNIEDIFSIEIFSKIEIRKETKYSYSSWESIYDLSEVYSKSALVDKFILAPENLSMLSSSEELQAVVEKYRSRLTEKAESIKANFEIQRVFVGNGEYQNLFKPKEEFFKTLFEEAKIELAEENKLSRDGFDLARYFCQMTNKQMDYKPKDIDLNKCNLPYEDEVNLSQFETNDTMPKTEPLYQDNSNYEKLFKGLSAVVQDLESLKIGFYSKSGKMGDAIMPLSVEVQMLPSEQSIIEGDCYKLIMEQNYIQNGDLMSDPRIDFAIYPALKLAVPLDFEQHNMGIYQFYVEGGKVVSASGIKSTIDFCLNAWFPNLTSTDRIISQKTKEVSVETPTIAKEDIPTINTIGDLYFHNNESHILGKMSIGFRNMILVDGTIEDAKNYFEDKFKHAELINGEIDNIDNAVNEVEQEEQEEQETMPTKEEIEKAIKALNVLAKYGDENAIKAIKALKILLV